MRIREITAVALGGALGTLARVGALEAAEGLTQGVLIATLTANTLGAFGLALVVARGLPEFPSWVRSGISIGFFGSYTTFSAVSLIAVTETMAVSLGYLAVTLLAGAAGVLVGRALGLRLQRRTSR